MIVSRVYDAQRAAEMGGVLDIEKLIDDIAVQDKPAFALTDVDDIVKRLTGELRSGDVVAIMSNGAFGGIHETLLAALHSPAWFKPTLRTFQTVGLPFVFSADPIQKLFRANEMKEFTEGIFRQFTR